jgi:fructose-specific phosphotransferase system component IIB
MKMNAEALIARALAMPHTHKIVTRYADGKERTFTTRNLASAEMHAVGERRKIGRKLIDRETMKPVCVVSVEVSEIA